MEKQINITAVTELLSIEMSKQVRQLKKERKIQNYSIDQNGKFFIKKNGQDSSFEFISFEDIQKLVGETWFSFSKKKNWVQLKISQGQSALAALYVLKK